MWGHNSRKEYPWVEVVAIAPLECAGDPQHRTASERAQPRGTAPALGNYGTRFILKAVKVAATVANASPRSGKVLDKLPDLLKRMREMLVRFLGTVQAAHVAFLDEGAFERWSKPTQRGTRRLAGIDLNKAHNRHLVHYDVKLFELLREQRRPGSAEQSSSDLDDPSF
jgi:hypothetical protein